MQILYMAAQLIYWAGYATISGYLSVYLLNQGFSNTVIGTLVCLSALVATILQPLLASVTDRLAGKALKTVTMAETGFFLACALILMIWEGKSLVLTGLIYGTLNMMLQLMMPFINSLGSIPEKTGYRLNFSIARGMGSIGYAGASFLVGKLIGIGGLSVLLRLIIPMYALLLLFLAAYPFPPVPRKEKPVQAQKEARSVSFFAKYPSFLFVLIGATLMTVCHSTIITYAFQIIESKGGGKGELGVALFVCAISELPVMFGFSSVRKKLAPGTWLVISGFFFIARGLGSLLMPTAGGFIAVQVLEMLSWGLLTLSSVFYVSSIMETEDDVKGQALFAATKTISNLTAALLGGVMLDTLGVNSILILAFSSASAGTAIVAAALHMEKARKA